MKPPMPDDLDYISALVLSIIAVFVIAASAATVRFHAHARRATPGSHGLLVWHIVTIAGSVSGTWLFILLGQLDLMGIFSTPRAVRLIAYSLFGVLTVTAIMIIALSARRRITQTGSTTTVEVSTDTTTTEYRD